MSMFEEKSALLYQKGVLNYFDIRWGRFISGLTAENNLESFLGAALVSSITRNGDVCLELDRMSGKTLAISEEKNTSVTCPELGGWKKKLATHPGVGQPGERRPLILDHEKNRLYLYRYWQYEKELSDSIHHRVRSEDAVIELKTKVIRFPIQDIKPPLVLKY